MTIEDAMRILRAAESRGRVRYSSKADALQLQGSFTLEELEAIALLLREAPEKLELDGQQQSR